MSNNISKLSDLFDRKNNTYHIDEFQYLYDEDFVYAVYIAVLKRVPDENGLNFYVSKVRQGMPKCLIIEQILNSNEAKGGNIRIEGLDARLKEQKLLRMPVVGRILAILVFVYSIRAHMKELRALENHVARLSSKKKS